MRIKLVANALIASTKIGTVQASYFLLNLPTVQLSRTVENVNPLHRQYIRRKLKMPAPKGFVNNEENACDVAINDESVCDGTNNDETNENIEDEQDMDLNGSALITSFGIGTSFGKRDFYSSFVKQQRSLNTESDSNIVSFYALMTSYSFVNEKPSDSKLPMPERLKTDEHGIINAPQKCKLGRIVLVPRRQLVVINMSPCIPIDNECERSAYATLLLHTP